MNKWLLVILVLFCFVACDDDFATGADMQPVASADTLHLGTILTGNSSPTYLLKLYNRNDKDLQLTSIVLRNAGSSGFRMNVDGLSGSSFTQSEFLRIASGDSLFMFVEATFPEAKGGITQHLDYVDVTCNGKTSTIVLEALSKDVKKLRAYTVTKDETWSNAQEVQIYDSLVVAKGVTLTLSDSATLYLHDKANIVVYGRLKTRGTKDRPVTIRGDRTDNMFDNLPYDNLPSQWGSLYLRKESRNSSLEYTNIHGMSEGIFVQSDARFTNCRIKNSDGNLLTALNAQMNLENCELSNCSGSLLDLTGGTYTIVHCTLANYNFASIIRQEAVRLSNRDTLEVEDAPLHKCEFVNTIVWGKRFDPDIRLDYYKPIEGDSIFSYSFDHCLLHANGEDDEQFVGTIWNEDPMFVLIDNENYTYDLHLDKDSPCICAGNESWVAKYPKDIEGNRRQEYPSIGCYEK